MDKPADITETTEKTGKMEENTSPPIPLRPIPRKWIPERWHHTIPEYSVDKFEIPQEIAKIDNLLYEQKKNFLPNVEVLKDKIKDKIKEMLEMKSVTNTRKIQALVKLLEDIDEFYFGNKYYGFYRDGWLERFSHDYIVYLDIFDAYKEFVNILWEGQEMLKKFDHQYYTISFP